MNNAIALVTEARFADGAPAHGRAPTVLAEDRLLAAALAKLGWETQRVVWSDPTVAWTGFRAAVLRSPWDYSPRFAEFSAWLDRVAAATTLLNPPAVVRWNLDKRYLTELAGRGVPTIPTTIVERGDAPRLAERLAALGAREAVVKPCVSAGARHTYRVEAGNAGEFDRTLAPLLAAEAFMVQPYLPSIADEGETSLILFAGKASHAVRKIPAPGDFRVQEQFGGTTLDTTPSAEQTALAEAAVAAAGETLPYARVDMVRGADGRWLLIELEIVEPHLWLARHPPAADAFAAALAERLRH